MLLPETVPLMLRVLGGDESWILPLRVFPVCVQVRTKVPEKAPLYVPFQVPVRSTAAAELLEDEVVLLVDCRELVVVDVLGALVELDEVDDVVSDEPQAAISRAPAPAKRVSLVRCM
ncbi:MAG TPA: hypothetical protein VIX82_13570 [Solirubrobacteraceae bacterium]